MSKEAVKRKSHVWDYYTKTGETVLWQMEPKNPPPEENDPKEIVTRPSKKLVSGNPPEDPKVTFVQKLIHFFVAHWRGLVIIIVPLTMLFMVLPFPGKPYAWCGYTLTVMAFYWVTECIPLPVSAFFPLLIFPLTNVMTAAVTAKCYFNDTIAMFLGSLMLATSVEQCGLHNRLALCAVRSIGYSHYKLLLAMCSVTTFVSMWIANTAATTMMVPIIWALLKVFEDEGLLHIFETDADGNQIASSLTTCYFCSAAYSATIGGIGTLVGTGTNLVFRGLFQEECSEAIDYLSFAYFSGFAIPYMIIMEFCIYIWLIFYYFGFLRPKSDAAKRAYISPAGQNAAKKAVDEKWKALGPMTCWEYMVAVLFVSSMVLFFSRSPVIFVGWGDQIQKYYNMKKNSIKDSACAALVNFIMMFLPYNISIFKHFTAKFREDLPSKPIRGILDWTEMSAKMPYSFMFMLGGGFCLSTASNKSNTDLNRRIGEFLQMFEVMPNTAIVFMLIAFTTLITNLGSNVAVVNVVGPIAMTMAQSVKQNPLQYIVVTGFCASYAFMLPVGTPPNLVVRMVAKIPTMKMVVAGSVPTVTTILVTFAAIMLWAPVIWPDIKDPTPAWCADKPPEPPAVAPSS